MDKISLNLNASFAVLSPSGSAGVIHTFVNLVTRDNAVVTTYQESPKTSFLSVKAQVSVH